MTTQELVQKLIDYVKEGRNVDFEKEYYGQDVLSMEQNGYSAQGLEAVIAKTQAAGDMFEEFYSGGVETAFVGQDNFLLVFHMDVKPKGGERMQMKEYGFYKVKDGKVSEEYFFAQPMA
jgi:hypothetical protein